LRASVDLGIVNLATVYAEDGTWYIFKGGSVLSQYEYYSKKISRVQKVLARHGQRTSRRLKLLYDKRRRFLRHALNSMVRKIMEELKERGVRKVVVGHPKGVAKNQGNKLTVNFWNYSYIIAVNILHIPESQGSRSGGQLLARDRGNGLKTSLVYRWTNGAGWVKKHPTSCEVMKMKAVNHKPMIRPEGTLAL
jgi:putative transposase